MKAHEWAQMNLHWPEDAAANAGECSFAEGAAITSLIPCGCKRFVLRDDASAGKVLPMHPLPPAGMGGPHDSTAIGQRYRAKDPTRALWGDLCTCEHRRELHDDNGCAYRQVCRCTAFHSTAPGPVRSEVVLALEELGKTTGKIGAELEELGALVALLEGKDEPGSERQPVLERMTSALERIAFVLEDRWGR